MKRLSSQSYWDSVYDNLPKDGKNRNLLLFFIKEKIKFYTRDYSNYLIWEVIFPRFLPKNSDLKIIEVGCAPGKYLVNFNKQFGYEPYGVEYSEKGVEITRNNFSKHRLKEENVIKADFFDTQFQQNNKDKYDLVFSRGFIEHFDDVLSVVKNHYDLVKSGGYVIIMIPNLQGLNYYISRFLNIDSLNLHNISIMEKQKFSSLFPKNKIDVLCSEYVGYFSFGLFNTNRKWKYYIYRIMLIIQRPFDLLFRVIFRSNFVRGKYLSPYLLLIGRKR